MLALRTWATTATPGTDGHVPSEGYFFEIAQQDLHDTVVGKDASLRELGASTYLDRMPGR